jgi:hypothetical protein
MRQIRKGVFETNSSSTHSITICSGKDYEAWQNGELYWSRYSDRLISKEEFEEKFKKWMNERYPNVDDETLETERPTYIEEFCEEEEFLTAEQYDDQIGSYYEEFQTSYTTASGEEVVAFGYYGYDG